MEKKYINKVNILSLSRVLFSIIATVLLFTGDLNLLVIAFIVIGISETTDLIDGYVARRENLVTDLGKILDPMSDSISRFLYFFALAYNGLFPIWFLIIFFLRDLIVSKIRLSSSLNGFVMGARFSGKLKSSALFVGQYLLLIALIYNTIYSNGFVELNFILITTIIGATILVGLMVIYKIKGNLLILILISTAALILFLASFLFIDIHLNKLITNIIATIMFAISLYALIDYIFVYKQIKSKFYYLSALFFTIFIFIMLTPICMDYWYYGQVCNDISCYKNDKYISQNDTDNLINDKEICRLVHELSDHAYFDDELFVLDNSLNKVFRFTNYNQELKLKCSYDTGYNTPVSIAVISFNNNKYLLLANYLFSNEIYFTSINDLSQEKELRKQTEFSIISDFYIKDMCVSNNELVIEVNKCSKFYNEIEIDKFISTGNYSNSIKNIYKMD